MRGVAEVGSTANKYEILAKLATGGMAEIFLARGAGVAGVERYVVLKRILRDRANDAHFVQMFLEEARLAAQLNHPNVAQVFDIGKLGDSYFFTMEYVHGETVRNLLHRARSLRREIPLSCILTVIAGAATGLHHAHDRLGLDGRPLGIVHRDVSPSNLMISYEGSVKLVDFGVAKADNRAQETRSGAVKGKISYLSPEQIGGARLDRRSDLFALGIVLWEMLTTERLYRRASDFENMNAIVNEAPEVPSRWRANLPRELDELSVRLLSKRPEHRYQSGDELVEAIEALAARVGAQLSSAALGRFMRELFGQRPEPWHEVEFRDAPPEGVTVTSEPVPPELVALDPVELDLARVRDLSKQFEAVGSQSALGAPVPPHQDLDIMKTLRRDDLMKTIQDRAPATHESSEVRMTIPMAGVSPPMTRMPRAPTAPPASQMPRAASHPGISSEAETRRRPVAPPMPMPMPAPVARRKPAPKGQLALVVGVAAALGVAATIIVLVATGDPEPAPAVTSGPAEPRSPPPPAPPSEAEPLAAPPVDAAIPVAPPPPPPVDAAVVVAPRTPATPANHPQKLTTAYAEGRYEDVIALCRESVGDRGVLCTLAACRSDDEARAKQWLARVPTSKRSAVQEECKDAGLDDLAPIKAKPRPDPSKDCERDPMACQH